jgi:hypothetical protein
MNNELTIGGAIFMGIRDAFLMLIFFVIMRFLIDENIKKILVRLDSLEAAITTANTLQAGTGAPTERILSRQKSSPSTEVSLP